MSKAWSYSMLTSWETCPRRHYLTRVCKVVVEPQTEATTHGNAVHKALEGSVRDALPLDSKYKQYEPLVETIRSAPGVKQTEYKFALTRNFTPTGYWDKDAWVRGVLDLQVLQPASVTILDYKTGKPKPDADQLKLFAAAGFALHPRAKTIRTGYAWLAYNRLDTEVFRKGDEAAIWQDFLPRIQRMESAVTDRDHPPKPSGLCAKWCPVPKRLCEFSGKD